MLQPGDHVGRYEIQATVGKGGFGQVYQAWDPELERLVAIKELSGERQAGEPNKFADYKERFKLERRVQGQFQHPHIVSVYDLVHQDGSEYLVEEFVEGGTLRALLDQEPRLPPERVVQLGVEICQAITAIWEADIVHRDIKPSNILLTGEGHAKLTDFGVAQVGQLSQRTQADSRHPGTPAYMSPEQESGHGYLDERSDLYALGLVLYEALTGKNYKRERVPASQLAPDVPKRLEHAVMRALANDPGDRYQHAHEFGAALRQPLEPPRQPRHIARGLRWIGSGLAVVLIISGGVFFSGMWNRAAAPTAAPITPSRTSAPSPTATRTPTASPTATMTPRPPSPTPSPTWILTPTLGSTQISEKDGMVQVYIPAGKFVMGAADSDPYAKANERPRHTVILDAFWVDRTEVTNAMFTSFVTATGYKTQAERNGQGYAWTGSKWELTSGTDWQHPNGPTTTLAGLDNHPVVQMSWVDVQAYCQWAGRRPITEAEWEKAARGTDGQRYPWGNQLPAGTLLNFADRNLNTNWADKKIDDGYELTAPVGSYPDGASPYGVLDMAGNAWEWVADWDGEYAYSIQTNPTGPLMGTQKILRGGSWYDRMEYVRAAYRPPISLDATYSNMGFRCAASEKK